jgi:hypothetical protein
MRAFAHIILNKNPGRAVTRGTGEESGNEVLKQIPAAAQA